MSDVAAIIAAHEAAGYRFSAAGTGSFVRDEGQGEAVVCLHGVPVSGFLYRRVVPELAERGMRGIAFDFPGLGLADRPVDFDYSWTGLGHFACKAVDALELDRFHLVVHDIGGPVGFELAHAMPDRVKSLTILNTLIDVATFRKPWVMRPFGWTGLGEVWLAGMTRPVFRRLMAMQGIADMGQVAPTEIDAHLALLKRQDRGAAFLRIMRGFEPTPAKQAIYRAVVADTERPVQILWGAHDPALKLARYGAQARAAAPADTPLIELPGKHFLQEDCAPAIAERVAMLAGNNASATDKRG